MDFKDRLKHLTKGFAASKNLEEGIENGTISDHDTERVYNMLNLVALLEIKGLLEQEIPLVTKNLMEMMDQPDGMEYPIQLVNAFLDILMTIKDKVDKTSAGNVDLG